MVKSSMGGTLTTLHPAHKTSKPPHWRSFQPCRTVSSAPTAPCPPSLPLLPARTLPPPPHATKAFFVRVLRPGFFSRPPFSVPPCSAGADGQEMEERRLEAVRGGAAEMGWTRGQIAAWLKCCTQRGQCVSLPRPHPQTTRGEIFIFPPVDARQKAL